MKKGSIGAFTGMLMLAMVLATHARQADTLFMGRCYDSLSAYMDTNAHKALPFMHAGLAHARQYNHTTWQGYFLQAGGVIHDIANNLDSGLYYYDQTLALARQQQDTVLEANALGNIGAAYHARGYLQPALKYHLAAAALRAGMPNKWYLAKSYNNIGLLYRMLKDYDKALYYFTQSIQLKQTAEDSLGVATTLLNISTCYPHQQGFDSALVYAQKALALAIQLKHPAKIAVANGNIGLAWLGKNKPALAYPYLQQAAAMAKAINSFDEEYFAIYNGMGLYYHHMANLPLSQHWYTRGLNQAMSSNRREQQVTFLKKLAQLHAEQGQYKQAYTRQQMADQLNDSLLNETALRQLQEMNMVYETEQKEQRIQQLTNDAMTSQLSLLQSKRQTYLLLAFLAIAIAITGAIIWVLRANQTKNKKLEAQKAIIENQLQEKEILMREIHHRVKNNLQIISGLLNLQSRHINDPNALQAVREGRNRVKSIALIHQQLYQHQSLTAVNLQAYLHELMQSIHQSFKDIGKHISHTVQCPHLLLDVEVAVPIGLILNELVTNSYKYAFTQQEQGHINLTVTTNQTTLHLHIKDNGTGLPELFNWHQQKTFGTKMINTLVSKLNATLTHQNEQGLLVIIEIPNYTNLT